METRVSDKGITRFLFGAVTLIIVVLSGLGAPEPYRRSSGLTPRKSPSDEGSETAAAGLTREDMTITDRPGTQPHARLPVTAPGTQRVYASHDSLPYGSTAGLPGGPGNRTDTPGDSGRRTKYAILINGDDEPRHRHNICEAYYTLRDHLGFEDRNLFVLSTSNPRPQGAGHDSALLDGSATKRRMGQVVEHLCGLADDNDLLIVYVTGHGRRSQGYSRICLHGEEMTSAEYRDLLERTPFEAIVSITDQCFSGGFPEELASSAKRIIAVSEAAATDTTCCNVYSRAFWWALRTEHADANKDGRVSVKEAHEHAMKEHKDYFGNRFRDEDGRYICTREEDDIILN